MKLLEIRKLERMLIASGTPFQVKNYQEGCNIICGAITAVEYTYSHGLELINEKRGYSPLRAEDVFQMMKSQYKEDKHERENQSDPQTAG